MLWHDAPRMISVLPSDTPAGGCEGESKRVRQGNSESQAVCSSLTKWPPRQRRYPAPTSNCQIASNVPCISVSNMAWIFNPNVLYSCEPIYHIPLNTQKLAVSVIFFQILPSAS